MDFDLVVSNGTIVDGTGRPRFRADLGIHQGRIAIVARDESLSAASHPSSQILDASGLIVAPGFIDVHSHSDWILPLPDHAEILAPLLLQGITTVVTGQCGFSPAPVTEESVPLVDAFSEMLRERAFPYRWRSMAEFLDTLQGRDVQPGLSLLNAATLVGHGTLRYAVMGDRSDTPTQEEMESLRQLTRQTLREGAFGLSAGLAYAPGIFARNEELLALLELVAEEGGIFTVHGRAYTWVSPFYRPMIVGTAHNIRSVRELLDLACRSGVRLQLSHQIFVGRRTWRTHRKVLAEIERAADKGLDVAFDAFPYPFGNTTVNVVLPEWFLAGFETNIDDPVALRKLKREMDLLRLTLGLDYADITLMWGCVPEFTELEGLDFDTIARRLDMSPFDAYVHVIRRSGGQARALLGTYSGDDDYEAPLQAVLTHPLCAFMTDTILTRQGVVNPASYGTFPRILGRYCRDLGLFSLEEAVRRMTSFSAERIGLAEVGRIAEGLWADLVLFDAGTVADRAGSEAGGSEAGGRPRRLGSRAAAPPSGIQAVLVGGQIAARDGQVVESQRRQPFGRARVLRR